MSGRTTLGLLLAVLAAGGALWWARLHVPGSGEREAAAARLWDLPVETGRARATAWNSCAKARNGAWHGRWRDAPMPPSSTAC